MASKDFEIKNGVLKKYKGDGGDVVIPDGVTEIGDEAFKSRRSLTSVVIPEGVTVIKYKAFYGCISLASVTIPASVEKIGNYAFKGCTSLTSVTIPEGVTEIGLCAFRGCTSLASAVIPASVTKIDSWTFDGCASLTSVTIPEGVTEIYQEAFSGCASLTSVKIPASVKEIGSEVFKGCGFAEDFKLEVALWRFENCLAIKDGSVKYCTNTNAEKITIPEGVTEIGCKAFSDCTSLTAVTIPASVTEIGEQAFDGCTSLTAVTIPASITKICDGAFYGCTSLASVSIPDCVKKIDYHTFTGCTSLASVVIPEGVTKIDSYAFDGCTSLASVTIPEGVTEIDRYAFRGCTSLTAVVIPESVTEIGEQAFRGCTSLTSVTISEGVAKIGRSAFSGCTSLASVAIPASVTEIGYWAFGDCGFAEGFKLEAALWRFENCVAIKDGVVEYCTNNNIEKITIPEGVTEIGESAFDGCGFAEDFKLEVAPWRFENCVAIKDGVVEYCTNKNAEKITIPEGVTEIGEEAFYKCTSLTSVEIPESVKEIGSSAFSGCASLASVTVPASVTEIGESAFDGCGFAEDFKLEAAGWRFENCLAIKDGVVGYCTNANAEKIAIPEGVTKIGGYAFRGCKSLASVDIPEGVTEIGERVFEDCESLASVDIPESVKKIGGEAFYYCKSLVLVEVPSSAKIDKTAFPEMCEIKKAAKKKAAKKKAAPKKKASGENYSGLVEEGFAPHTVGWDSLFDFLKEHSGEKIDVTIAAADHKKAKKYFAQEAEGESRAEDFFAAIGSLGLAPGSLVLRLPNGLNHLGASSEAYNAYDLPACVAKLYLPPTFWARWDNIDKDRFVVPSNYTYVTRRADETDRYHRWWTEHYNTEAGEVANRCKTYETDVKHFPAGKYKIWLGSNNGYQFNQVIYSGDSVAEIAQAMLDQDYDDKVGGIGVQWAKLFIKNCDTGKKWKMTSDNRTDEEAELWIEGVMPCYNMEQCVLDEENYYLARDRRSCYEVGGDYDDEDDDGEDFPEGFNFGDISLLAFACGEEIATVALKSVADEDAEEYSDPASDYESIHILGKRYDYKDLKNLAGKK